MKTKLTTQIKDSDIATSNVSSLYTIGGAAALLMVVIILTQLIVFVAAPPPLEGTVYDWFALFQRNALVGLLDFELLMVVYVIMSIPLTLALYRSLAPSNPSWMTIYLALSLVGVIAFIAARPAFEMLSLSTQYAAATSDVEKARLLAAGEVMIAIFHGTAFQVSYMLGSITGLIVSVVMLKSNIFGRATAYLRFASSLFDFGIFVPVVGIYISILSVLFLLAWDILVARKLLQLRRAPDGS